MGRRLVLALVVATALAAPPAMADLGAATPPELTVELSPARFKAGQGTTFTWQASEPVEVGIRIEQRVPPKRKGGKATFKRLGLILRNAPAGEGSFKFSGRIPGKGALKAGALGRYQQLVQDAKNLVDQAQARLGAGGGASSSSTTSSTSTSTTSITSRNRCRSSTRPAPSITTRPF